MKVITALVICGFAAIAYAALEVPAEAQNEFTPNCPPSNGQNVTLIANPENCTTYFVCNSGYPILMICPPGLHFNDREKACDWPGNACCDPAYDPENECEKNA